MELVKEQIQMERKKGTASRQITFDEPYNLPETLPDIYTFILSRGEIRLDECKAGQGQVMVRGVVKFRALYRTDQNEWKISSLEGEIPFQEELKVDGTTEFDMVSAVPVLEDLTLQIIHSRKLNIRALMELAVTVSERCDAELPVGFDDEKNLEILREKKDFLKLIYNGKESCHIREEIRIPSNKPNIRQIIWQQTQIFGIETRVSDGELDIQGEIQLFLVYGSEENGSLQWFVSKIPYQCSFEIPEAKISAIPWISVRTQNLVCSMQNDDDGEARILLLEADLPADVRLYEEQPVNLVQDAYLPDKTLTLGRKNRQLSRLHMKNEAICRVNETIKIQNADSEIMQICAGFGSAEVDQKELTDAGVLVEGAVNIQLLYLTENDNMPIEASEEVLPFRHLIELPYIEDREEKAAVELQYSLDALSFLMKSNREVEVQALVKLQILASIPQQMEVIDEVSESPLPENEWNAAASAVVLTLSDTDTLWNIAKRYHTTVSNITQINHLEDQKPAPGKRILLLKRLPESAE